MKKRYCLNVFYAPFDEKTEESIEKLVGKFFENSGCWLEGDIAHRDLQFEYELEAAALVAQERVTVLKEKLPGFHTEVISHEVA